MVLVSGGKFLLWDGTWYKCHILRYSKELVVCGFWLLLPSRISCSLLVNATAISFYEIREADLIGLGVTWPLDLETLPRWV